MSSRHTDQVSIPGLSGAHERDHPPVLLHGAAPAAAATIHVGGDRRHRQVGSGGH